MQFEQSVYLLFNQIANIEDIDTYNSQLLPLQRQYISAHANLMNHINMLLSDMGLIFGRDRFNEKSTVRGGNSNYYITVPVDKPTWTPPLLPQTPDNDIIQLDFTETVSLLFVSIQ